jgi:hypothetical protein
MMIISIVLWESVLQNNRPFRLCLRSVHVLLSLVRWLLMRLANKLLMLNRRRHLLLNLTQTFLQLLF